VMVVALVRGSLLAGLAVEGVVPRASLARRVLVTVHLAGLLVPARRAVLARARRGCLATSETSLGADFIGSRAGSLLSIVTLVVGKDNRGGGFVEVRVHDLQVEAGSPGVVPAIVVLHHVTVGVAREHTLGPSPRPDHHVATVLNLLGNCELEVVVILLHLRGVFFVVQPGNGIGGEVLLRTRDPVLLGQVFGIYNLGLRLSSPVDANQTRIAILGGPNIFSGVTVAEVRHVQLLAGPRAGEIGARSNLELTLVVTARVLGAQAIRIVGRLRHPVPIPDLVPGVVPAVLGERLIKSGRVCLIIRLAWTFNTSIDTINP